MGILGGSGSSNFDRLLESATSQLHLEPNWQDILELCDTIRQKDVTAKYALAAIRKKVNDKNPHVAKFALVTLEACMKNCGGPMHDEVATHEFMDEIRSLVKSGSDPIKEQILSMIQTWNQTLGKKPTYRVIQDTYNILKAEGYAFPQLNESDAMYLAETAPEWAEGDVCHQCRVKFTTFTRQHHCRCCGQVFCAKCSSKSSVIPKYGIEREVRVCDACYESLNRGGASSTSKSTASGETQSLYSDDLPAEYLNSSLAKEAQTKPQPSEAEIKAQEEEELQLAMALSLSAAESEQQNQPKKGWVGSSAQESIHSSPASLYSEPKSSLYTDVVTDSKRVSESHDSELSHYLNRDYWEKRKDGRSTEPSAPIVHEEEVMEPRGYTRETIETEDAMNEDAENSDAFVKTISQSIEMFINRIQTVKSKGKHVAMDSTVQSLFQSLSAMHPQLMKLIEDEEDNKAKYQTMLEKVAMVREARESLDNMRNQHREKLRQQELEQEMLRRMQMEQKLELMRQQKQEYLEYQRQLQIQRQQEMEQQQQLKVQQKQYQYNAQPQFANYPQQQISNQYEPGAGDYPVKTAYPAGSAATGQSMPASPMQYPAAAQYPQSAGSYDPRMEQIPKEAASIPGQGVSQRQPQFQPVSSAQSQPVLQVDQAGYRGQSQMSMGQQSRPQIQAPQPDGQLVVSSIASSQMPQHPDGYVAKIPDLLDAPIGSELEAQKRESQPHGYGGQVYRTQQMTYAAQGGQEYPNLQQQQQQYPQSQQQQQYSQSQPQQPFQSLPRNQLQQHQLSSPHQQQLNNQPGVQQSPYSQAAISNTQPSYSNQPIQQPYQQTQNVADGQELPYHRPQPSGNVPNQYVQMQVPAQQQGPASLPYMGQQSSAVLHGPASLPANLNQYPGAPSGYVNDASYGQNIQSAGRMHQQQLPQQAINNQEMQLTENMKDLQLISFE